jgi:hypothetical protein
MIIILQEVWRKFGTWVLVNGPCLELQVPPGFAPCQRCQAQQYVLSRVWVTIDGVRIVNLIYWPLTDCNHE